MSASDEGSLTDVLSYNSWPEGMKRIARVGISQDPAALETLTQETYDTIAEWYGTNVFAVVEAAILLLEEQKKPIGEVIKLLDSIPEFVEDGR